jgi:hypothetical protein
MPGSTSSGAGAPLAGNSLAKIGTIIQLDDQSRAVSYLDFTNARIVEFGVPASDPAGTEDSLTLVASIGASTERPGDNEFGQPVALHQHIALRDACLHVCRSA